jgi:ferredoxin-NADP reductase
MKVVFDHHQAEADNIWTFFFKPEHSLHYTAGQFIELTLPHVDPDKRGIKRWFTLSSSPTDEMLTITTKFAAQNSSSFKLALRTLVPGTEVTMSDAMGDFVLPKLAQTPLVFVAGGIGLTPFHSIFSWLAATGEKRPIRFLYAVTSEDEIICQDTFEKAGIHATIVVSKPTESWGGERGRLTAELILGLEILTPDTMIYISGPEPMVESLGDDLHKKGISRQHIVGDYFPNYTQI